MFNAATGNDPATYGTAITIGGFSLTGGESRSLIFTNTIALDQYGVDNSSAFNFSISGAANTTLTSAQTWSVTGTGNTTFAKAIVNGGNLLTLNGSNTGIGTISGNISGSGGVTKSGSGTWVLSGANSYTGETLFDEGIVNVANLTNYGVAGSLGARTSAQEGTSNVGLHFTGGTLQYTGSTAQSTDRGIRVGNDGATLDASGSNPSATISFTRITANVDIWDSPGSRTLNLTGSNTGNNTFAINWQGYGPGGASNIVKSGAGTWVLTNAGNSAGQTDSYNTLGGYGGGTVLSGGTLGFTNNAIGGGVVSFNGNSTLRWESGNTQDISTGSGAGINRSVNIANGVTATFNTNGNNVTLSNAFTTSGGTAGAVTKTGAGTLTLSSAAAQTYTGVTTVSGGKLTIASGANINSTSSVTISGGEFNYNSTALSKTVSFSGTGGTLTGTGTITNAVTVTTGNTYSAGALGDAGTQALSSGIAFNTGSIFSWDLDASVADTGANAANSGTYDIVTGNGTGNGTFNVVLGLNKFTDVFWNTNKTWNNIFSGTDPGFTLFGGTDGISTVASNGSVTGQGGFTYSGNTLSWTAVPEPSSALAGLLLGAGLLRRSRKKRALSW